MPEEPLLLTNEVPSAPALTEDSIQEPVDVHAHTLWSRIAIGLWLLATLVFASATAALVTLVGVGYDLFLRIECTAFWTFQPGLSKSIVTIHTFEIGQYATFVLACYSGYRALRTMLFGRVVRTGTVRISVAHAA